MTTSSPSTGLRSLVLAALCAAILGACGSAAGTPSSPQSSGPGAGGPARPPAGDLQSALVSTEDVADANGRTPQGGHLQDLTDPTIGIGLSLCIGGSALGALPGSRTAYGQSVSQPPSQPAAISATEAVVVDTTTTQAGQDAATAEASARACPATTSAAAPGGTYGDSVTVTATRTGAWSGVEVAGTFTMDPAQNGVSRLASYGYLLHRTAGGFVVVEISVTFAGVAPSAAYQQQAAQLVATLLKHLEDAGA